MTEPRDPGSGQPEISRGHPSPNDESNHGGNHRDYDTDSNRYPMKGSTGVKTPLRSETEAELDSDAHRRTRYLDQEKCKRRHVHESADRDRWGPCSGNEASGDEHLPSMTVEERLHLQNAFGMGYLLEPSSIEKTPSVSATQMEPKEITERDSRPGRDDGPNQWEIARGDLPARRRHDQIFGEVESDAREHQDEEQRPGTPLDQHVLDEVVGGLMHPLQYCHSDPTLPNSTQTEATTARG